MGSEALRRIIDVWDSLPEGYHSSNRVQLWLYLLADAIAKGREEIAENHKRSG
jgi:hypothetical protein